MENFNLLHEFALVCGIVITTIILLLVNKKQPKFLHDYLLTAFFIIILVLFLNHYANYHQLLWLYLGTNWLVGSAGFLIGPLVYFYVASLFTKVNYKKSSFWLAFLPALSYILTFTIPYSLSNPIDGLSLPYIQFYINYWGVFYFLETLFLLFCVGLALKKLLKYASVIPTYYSSLTTADILWSKRLLQAVILYLIIDIGLTISEVAFDNNPFVGYSMNVLTMLVVVLYLGYYGFFQSRLLLPSFLVEFPKEKPVEDKKNTSSVHPFSALEIKQIKTDLKDVLEKEQLYLQATLTLSDLAQKVNLTDKKLSTFINQVLGTNFYELVNQYRIAAFKEAITSTNNQHLTIWGVASQCGFNSKTSFNRIFKQQTGMTPSQYKKSIA